jgi:hypothetical protein
MDPLINDFLRNSLHAINVDGNRVSTLLGIMDFADCKLVSLSRMSGQTLGCRELLTALLASEVTVLLVFQQDGCTLELFVTIVTKRFEVHTFFFNSPHF